MHPLAKLEETLSTKKRDLFVKYHIRKLGVFGSYAKGTAKPESDIDVLVEYNETPSLISLIELEEHLSSLFGKKVDLVTKKGIKQQLAPSILNDVIYL